MQDGACGIYITLSCLVNFKLAFLASELLRTLTPIHANDMSPRQSNQNLADPCGDNNVAWPCSRSCDRMRTTYSNELESMQHNTGRGSDTSLHITRLQIWAWCISHT